jgi:DNA-binding transcriptional MerR regulator
MKGIKNNNIEKINTISLYRNEAFDIGFYQYFKNIKGNRISQILNSKERNIKFNEITYRQLNSWEKEGLLTIEREGREWRRFSIMDAVWVKLIKELREFGLSWEQLKVTKKSLEFADTKCGVSMPLLEFYIAFAIGSKMPILLLVFKDGVAVPANYSQYKINREFLLMENHLQINLNEVLQGFFPNVDLKPLYKTELPVDVDEMELLAFLRLANYEKVEIHYKSGKMQTIEGMQRVDANILVSDIIKEHKYQKIEIVVEDGRKVSLRRILKKQINKKG